MNDDRLSGVSAPKLDDDYIAPPKQNSVAINTASDMLSFDDDEDAGFANNSAKRSLDGIAAPSLDDDVVPMVNDNLNNMQMGDFVNPSLQNAPKGRLDDITAPSLEDAFSDEIPHLTKPQKDLSDVKAAQFEDSAPQTSGYTPNYTDPDLEQAKAQARNRAVQAALSSVPSSVDEKRSLEMYRMLMEEQKDNLAKKGGRIAIVLAVLGVVMSVVFFMYLQTALKSDAAGVKKVVEYISYSCYVSGAVSLLMMLRAKPIKGLSTFVFVLMTIITLLGGSHLLSFKADFWSSFAMLAAAVVINVFIVFTLGSSEALDMFYKRNVKKN